MTGTGLTHWNGPSSPQELYLYAETLAGSSLLPGAFRRNPENTFYACELGRALDIPAVTALAGIHVMDGKPTASAGLISALVRRDGHKLRVTVNGTVRAGDITVTAQIIRRDDPDWTFTAVWDLDRAYRAGLIDSIDIDSTGRHTIVSRTEKGKPTSWEKYTEAMLKARAISEVSREGAEDSLSGVRYTPEELGADVDEDGHVVPNGGVVITSTVVDDPKPAQQWPPQQRQPAAEPPADESTAHPAQAEPPARSPLRDLIISSALEADIEILRGTYRGAGAEGRAQVVTDLIPDHYTSRAVVFGYLTGGEPVTLEQWFVACSSHLTAHKKPLGQAADEDLALEAADDIPAGVSGDPSPEELGDAA